VPDPKGKDVYGRPVVVAIVQGGSLLILDDGDDSARVIWRMSYEARVDGILFTGEHIRGRAPSAPAAVGYATGRTVPRVFSNKRVSRHDDRKFAA
jgi:hypothetical protein